MHRYNILFIGMTNMFVMPWNVMYVMYVMYEQMFLAYM
jgi:hypothetical protein